MLCLVIATLFLGSIGNSNEFRQSTIENELDTTHRSTLLEPSQVQEYVVKLGGEQFYQVFFGLDLKEALEKGYKISIKSFFEYTGSPAMEYVALYTKELLAKQFDATTDLHMVDLFTGTGQAAYGFAKNGFRVTATELHEDTFRWASHNLELSGVKNTEVLHKNALDFISEAEAKKERFSVIFLDPPWNGKYTYDLKTPFLLEYTEPYAKDLVRKSLQLTSIVVLKGPQNISQEQIRSLAEELDCKALIQYQKMPNYPEELNHAVVYFIKDSSDPDAERYSTQTVALRSEAARVASS